MTKVNNYKKLFISAQAITTIFSFNFFRVCRYFIHVLLRKIITNDKYWGLYFIISWYGLTKT